MKKKRKKNCKQRTKRKQMPHLFAWLQPERLQRRLPFFSLNVLWICSTKLFWISLLAGFVQSLEFLKKSRTLPNNFPDLEKVWKIDIKSGKMGKSLELFDSYNNCVTSEVFFVLVKSYSILPVRLQRIAEKALFLHFFFLVTYLITLSFEKEIIVWEKVWKKVVNFGSKNLYDPRTWYTALILSLQTREEGCTVIIYDLRYDFCISFANEAVHILLTESKL